MEQRDDDNGRQTQAGLAAGIAAGIDWCRDLLDFIELGALLLLSLVQARVQRDGGPDPLRITPLDGGSYSLRNR